MTTSWSFALATTLLLQNPTPIPPGPAPQGGAPVVQPALGGQSNVVQPPASQPAPPPLTQEQIVERVALQITGLATRIQSLRKMGNVTTAPEAPGAPAAKPTLDELQRSVGEIARETQRRAQPLEVKLAASVAEELLARRGAPLAGGFVPAPEPKATVQPTAVAEGPVFPAFDPAKANDVLYRIGNTPITRGELEGLMQAVRPSMAEASVEQLAQAVLRRSLVQSAAIRNAVPEQVAAAMKKAKEIRENVTSGKLTFEQAVKESSDEVTARTFGGLIDGMAMGALTDAEILALSTMKPGDLSQPFLTSSNVELLQLESVTPGATPASTTYKFRRLLVSVDLGVPAKERFSKATSILMSARIEVLEPAYEGFLPPQLQRVVVKKN